MVIGAVQLYESLLDVQHGRFVEFTVEDYGYGRQFVTFRIPQMFFDTLSRIVGLADVELIAVVYEVDHGPVLATSCVADVNPSRFGEIEFNNFIGAHAVLPISRFPKYIWTYIDILLLKVFLV